MFINIIKEWIYEHNILFYNNFYVIKGIKKHIYIENMKRLLFFNWKTKECVKFSKYLYLYLYLYNNIYVNL